MSVNFGGGLSGAASGAAGGSALGPFGALAGGVLGGLAGLFGAGGPEELTPDQIAAMQAGGTEFDKIKMDPQAMSAWMAALRQLQGVASQNGMDLQSRVAQQQAQQQAAQHEQMQRQAIEQQMAQSQRYGGGQELAAKMMAQQGGYNTAAMAGAENAAAARQRALQAMAMSGQMAGNIRGQQFGEAAARAQSQDAINQFNARQRGLAYMANAGYNIAGQQRSNEMGAGIGSLIGGAVQGVGSFLKPKGGSSALGSYKGFADDPMAGGYYSKD